MESSETLVNLRKRMADAVDLGVVGEDTKPVFEATLIQIMKNAEKHRLRCISLAEQYRRQEAQAIAEGNAFSQMGSIVFAILNGFVSAAERDKEDIEETDREKQEDIKIEAMAKRRNKENVKALKELDLQHEPEAEKSESKPEKSEPKLEKKKTKKTTKTRKKSSIKKSDYDLHKANPKR